MAHPDTKYDLRINEVQRVILEDALTQYLAEMLPVVSSEKLEERSLLLDVLTKDLHPLVDPICKNDANVLNDLTA